MAAQEEEALRRRFRAKGLQLVLKEEMSAVNKKIDVRLKVPRSALCALPGKSWTIYRVVVVVVVGTVGGGDEWVGEWVGALMGVRRVAGWRH